MSWQVVGTNASHMFISFFLTEDLVVKHFDKYLQGERKTYL